MWCSQVTWAGSQLALGALLHWVGIGDGRIRVPCVGAAWCAAPGHVSLSILHDDGLGWGHRSGSARSGLVPCVGVCSPERQRASPAPSAQCYAGLCKARAACRHRAMWAACQLVHQLGPFSVSRWLPKEAACRRGKAAWKWWPREEAEALGRWKQGRFPPALCAVSAGPALAAAAWGMVQAAALGEDRSFAGRAGSSVCAEGWGFAGLQHWCACRWAAAQLRYPPLSCLWPWV